MATGKRPAGILAGRMLTNCMEIKCFLAWRAFVHHEQHVRHIQAKVKADAEANKDRGQDSFRARYHKGTEQRKKQPRHVVNRAGQGCSNETAKINKMIQVKKEKEQKAREAAEALKQAQREAKEAAEAAAHEQQLQARNSSAGRRSMTRRSSTIGRLSAVFRRGSSASARGSGRFSQADEDDPDAPTVDPLHGPGSGSHRRRHSDGLSVADGEEDDVMPEPPPDRSITHRLSASRLFRRGSSDKHKESRHTISRGPSSSRLSRLSHFGRPKFTAKHADAPASEGVGNGDASGDAPKAEDAAAEAPAPAALQA